VFEKRNTLGKAIPYGIDFPGFFSRLDVGRVNYRQITTLQMEAGRVVLMWMDWYSVWILMSLACCLLWGRWGRIQEIRMDRCRKASDEWVARHRAD
jgi:hypothetical protein